MDRERWARVKQVFQDVLELDADPRRRELERRCAGDDGLREEVESLLRSYVEVAESDGFLGTDDQPDRIDRYKILQPIGRGGMGVVYLAQQLEPIQREVAIKLIHSGMHTEELISRFQAERQALASMSHPNIAGVLDAGSTKPGHPYFVMEYVPGLPITEFCDEQRYDTRQRLELVLDVCNAIQHAHDRDIVHRDLKPTNVLVTMQNGKPVPKVIDFGVAKSTGLTSEERTQLTQTGQLIGTPGYMSPEQARGRAVDARADLWSIGCLLYEVLAGQAPFERENFGDTLASVLTTDPDWSVLPADTPAGVRRLLRRCLVKDPTERLHSAADARLEIAEALGGASEEQDPSVKTGRGRVRWEVPAAALLLVASIATIWLGRNGPPPGPTASLRKLEISVPGLKAHERFAPVLAPDGSSFAYVREHRLWIRRLDSLEASPIAGTEGAEYPFWSPDGEHVGYFTRGSIRRVPMDGGESATITDVRGDVIVGAGAAWTIDDTIVYSRGNTDLFEVRASGGDRRVKLAATPEIGEHFHGPRLLPDGRSLVFGVHRGSGADSMAVLSGGKVKLILALETLRIDHPVWSPSGHVLFQRGPTNAGIWAMPFSLDSLETGQPVIVASGGGLPSVAADGTLLYVPDAVAAQVQLAWTDRAGKLVEKIGAPELQIRFPRLAPDGIRVAASHRTRDGSQVWVQDLERSVKSRLTFGESGLSWCPSWSADGSLVAGHETFTDTDGTVKSRIWIATSDGAGTAREFLEGWAPVLTRDGRFVVYTSPDSNIEYAPIDDPSKRTPVIATPTEEREPELSPDDRFMAYVSNESGVWGIALTQFPAGAGKWQVSVDGGGKPRWSSRGDRIYYAHRNVLYEVDFDAGPPVRLGAPRSLFSGDEIGIDLEQGYDVSDDGRFLVLKNLVPENRDRAVLVQRWFDEFDE